MKLTTIISIKKRTIICAKVDPERKLIIMKYRQRIYYCAVVEHPGIRTTWPILKKNWIPPNVFRISKFNSLVYRR